MRYTYDIYGWYTGEIDTTVPIHGSSSVPPPLEVPEGSKANYIGNGWEILPYVEPTTVTVIPYNPPPTFPGRVLTKLQYMNRFTSVELANIYSAAKSVIQVEIWLEKFKLATEINLDDPTILEGLLAMEAAGLLEVGRANEIIQY